MPKLKPHQGTVKRIKVRKSGSLQHRKAFGSHVLEKKSAARKRRLARIGSISAADSNRIKRLIAS